MNTQIYTEASEWLIDFRADEVDAATRQRFDKWLSTSPEHVRAYLELTAIWEDASIVDEQRHVNVDLLIERARAHTNIVPLDTSTFPADLPQPATLAQPQKTSMRSNAGRPGVRLSLAASIAVLAIGAASWFAFQSRNIYSTGIGEQRSIALTDGSTVELNARSKLRLRFSEHERGVDLLQGQALFKVAKDKNRPFIVSTGITHVRAVGTQFDVYRKSTGTIVTVIEGTVAVRSAAAGSPSSLPGATSARSEPQRPNAQSARSSTPGESVLRRMQGEFLLSAGEQTIVTTTVSPQPRRANIAAVTAWTQRRLVFDSTPLHEVAEEFNRYNARQLIIDDPGENSRDDSGGGSDLEDFHVSGAFSSAEPEPLLRFLRAQGGISVVEHGDRIVITRK